LIALHPDAQGQGLGRALVDDGMSALQKQGYRQLSITWVADTNPASAALWTGLGARPIHTVETYELAL
jgi:ribosomal protein S18 acetylase RimI-like enzyme